MLEIRPITFKAACAYIDEHHRHNKPPRGMEFCISVWDSSSLAGVIVAGRPVARAFDDGRCLEVNRSCTTGARNANSMLYGAARRAAWAMGYRRIITYTRADESGDSLRAAGFVMVGVIPARKSWAESSVKLRGIRDQVGDGGVERVLWECVRS